MFMWSLGAPRCQPDLPAKARPLCVAGAGCHVAVAFGCGTGPAHCSSAEFGASSVGSGSARPSQGLLDLKDQARVFQILKTKPGLLRSERPSQGL